MRELTYILSTTCYILRKQSHNRSPHHSTIGGRIASTHLPYSLRHLYRLFNIVSYTQHLISILTYSHRVAQSPLLEMRCNILQAHPFVFNDSLSNTQHHIRIIRPVANLPSLSVSVLKYLSIMLYPVWIFPCHILRCHSLRPQTKGIPNCLTEKHTFKFIRCSHIQ